MTPNLNDYQKTKYDLHIIILITKTKSTDVNDSRKKTHITAHIYDLSDVK